jgi:microcystin-dependent protein
MSKSASFVTFSPNTTIKSSEVNNNLTSLANGESGMTGQLIMWPTSVAPTGWLLCNGQAVSRTTYSSLFNLLNYDGLPYGNGNGSSTFNVPNLKSRFPVGLDSAGTFNALANSGGTISPDLSHTHDAAIAGSRNGSLTAKSGPNQSLDRFGNIGTGGYISESRDCINTPSAGASGQSDNWGSSDVIGNTASALGANPIPPPYLVVNFIIKY